MMVKPSAGRQVPDPERGGFLPPEGREVEANVYWLRRLEDGDVIEFNLKPKPKGADK